MTSEFLAFVTQSGSSALGGHMLLAYLDPGSGSYLLQLLIAGVLGGLFIVKMQWSRIKGWFARKPKNPDEKE
jgi:hypothetical protein